MVKEHSDINRLVWPKHGDKLAWVDRAKALADAFTHLGTAWLGYQAFEKVVPGSGVSGAIVSQIALKLATAPNYVSGAAGVATLTGMGLLNVMDEETIPVKATIDWITWLHPVTWGVALRETLLP